MENPAESYGVGTAPVPTMKRINNLLPPLTPFCKIAGGNKFTFAPPSFLKMGALAFVPLWITKVSVGNIFILSTHKIILSAHGANKNPGQPDTCERV